MSVGIVRELAEIERLIEEAEQRALALSMKLVGSAASLDASAKPSREVPEHALAHSELLTRTGGDAADIHDLLGPVRRRAARAVKRSVDHITEEGE